MLNNKDGLIEFFKKTAADPEYLTIEKRELNFKNDQGYIKEGLYEYAATSVDRIIDHLCTPHEVEGNTTLLMVHTDQDPRSAQEILTSLARMGQDYQDATCLFSSKKERLMEIKEALQVVSLTQYDAVFLIDIEKLELA